MANVNRTPLKRARASTSAVKTRGSRVQEDRDQTEDREVTDLERVAMLRKSLFQASLPDLPKRPGYHRCWLTTQNPRDPVHGRIRLGYTLLRAVDVPEFESLGMKTGDYAGCIGVNEMIAAELPIHLYEAFMRECHFDEPLRQEESIYNDALSVGEQAAQAARRGGRMKAPVIEAGVEQMGSMDREPPVFSDDE
jgi:hypothetical protein